MAQKRPSPRTKRPTIQYILKNFSVPVPKFNFPHFTTFENLIRKCAIIIFPVNAIKKLNSGICPGKKNSRNPPVGHAALDVLDQPASIIGTSTGTLMTSSSSEEQINKGCWTLFSLEVSSAFLIYWKKCPIVLVIRVSVRLSVRDFTFSSTRKCALCRSPQ
jgi:hypothetical protein